MPTEPHKRSALQADPIAIARVRTLRDNQTPPEAVLWSYLRGRRLGGLKFRRQHPIDPFTADFFCQDAGLIVELDSSYHDRARDTARDAWCAERGIETLRVTAGDLARDPDAVLRTILSRARERIDSIGAWRAERRKEEKGA